MQKKVQKNSLKDSLQLFTKMERETPTKCHTARAMMEMTPTKAAPGSQPAAKSKSWPEGYRTLARYPKGSMKDFLFKRAPFVLTEQKLSFWKMGDKNIVQHLFEFETGLDLNKPWPKGPCHEKHAFEMVLIKWVTNPIDHQHLRQLLDGELGTQPNWLKKGVYQLLPEESEMKTHVQHSHSGRSVQIPASMRVDREWIFEDNWSAMHAKLVDKSGHGFNVSTFFPHAATSCVEWREFATQEAKMWSTTPSESEPSLKASLAQLCQNLQADTCDSVKDTPQTPTGSPLGSVFGLDSPAPAAAPAPASPLELPM